jgi:hypothetical protein
MCFQLLDGGLYFVDACVLLLTIAIISILGHLDITSRSLASPVMDIPGLVRRADQHMEKYGVPIDAICLLATTFKFNLVPLAMVFD